MIRSKQQDDIQEMMRGSVSHDQAYMQMRFFTHSIYTVLLILFTILLNYIFTHH